MRNKLRTETINKDQIRTHKLINFGQRIGIYMNKKVEITGNSKSKSLSNKIDGNNNNSTNMNVKGKTWR